VTAGEVRVVVAPDSFKGSLPADEAAAAIGAGLRAAGAAAGAVPHVLLRPVADGGEGTVAMLLAAGWAARRRRVTGPTGKPVEATFAVTPSGAAPRTAVVELAAASGLTLLPGGRPDPLGATTYGTGELVTAALDEGVERIVLAVGGSATTDGGTGLAAALGACWLDADGAPLAPGGGALRGLARLDVRDLDPRLRGTEVVVAADVDNPLTGPHGAAQVYGPQKGAGPAEVVALEAGLVRLADVLRRDLDRDVERQPGAGAAGGAAAVALAVLGARLVPGADLLLDLVRFDDALAGADLVVTGEGSVDHQTLAGKAPVGVARRAFAAGVPVLVLAGRTALGPDARAALADLGVLDVRALTDLEPDPAVTRREAARLLTELARRAYSDLAPHLTATRSPT
jgi:glycerate kinase